MFVNVQALPTRKYGSNWETYFKIVKKQKKIHCRRTLCRTGHTKNDKVDLHISTQATRFQITVLPTRSFGEHNEVRMLVWITLDELNACEVLPVPHSLFEQRFVWTAETAIDFIRYYSEIPYPFFSGSGRSASSRTYNVSIQTN